MASQLRAKLNRIQPSASRPVSRESDGVFSLKRRFPADEGAVFLCPDALLRLGADASFDIRQCLFLDTETTGLSGGAGTVAFLVGAGYLDGDEFVVEQHCMRDYSDEPELLSLLSGLLARFSTVVTFNGRTFDMPLLEARYTMCRMRDRFPSRNQLDLLHAARRTWKLRLGSCRLSALEEQILHSPRAEDLPGSEVPARYFRYLATGDFSLLRPVIEHNCQDIRTLLTLLIRLCEVYRRPEEQKDPRDLYSLARVLERRQDVQARELYRLAALPRPAGALRPRENSCEGLANWRLCELYRRAGEYEKMRAILEKMIVRRQLEGPVHIALAKDYEHRRDDPGRALQHAKLALSVPGAGDRAAILRRIERLEKKLRRKSL